MPDSSKILLDRCIVKVTTNLNLLITMGPTTFSFWSTLVSMVTVDVNTPEMHIASFALDSTITSKHHLLLTQCYYRRNPKLNQNYLHQFLFFFDLLEIPILQNSTALKPSWITVRNNVWLTNSAENTLVLNGEKRVVIYIWQIFSSTSFFMFCSLSTSHWFEVLLQNDWKIKGVSTEELWVQFIEFQAYWTPHLLLITNKS